MIATVNQLATWLVLQVDPNTGTPGAQRGAIQRIAEPTYYDYVFPALAFLLVIILPTVTALWVMYKTASEKKPEPDET